MVIISTKNGKIQGTQGDDFQSFLGIPYAKPPVEDLRFSEPQPLEPWSDVKKTTEFGFIAPQNIPDDPPIEQDQNEDCLYLNIWTPEADNNSRPVMFWIHGGGYVIGAGSRPRLHGKNLSVSGDVVVVTINYRLGALGFLNFPGIPPNLGIQDQVAALRWVKENIQTFGGDPNNITIFGESAGGMSVAILLAIPSSKGLFHKAIIESGNTNSRDLNMEKSKKGCAKFVLKLGIRDGNVDELRRIPFNKIMKVQKKIVGGLINLGDSPFWPFVDGEFITEQPIEIISKGKNHQVPLIIGYNENELGFLTEILNESGFVKKSLIMKLVSSKIKKSINNKDKSKQLIEIYKKELKTKFPDKPLMYLATILSDSMFKIPIVRQLEAHTKHQSDIYCYIFSYKSPKFGFAFHSFEIPFVFNTIDKEDFAKGSIENDENAKTITKKVMDTWINFARTGNPNNKNIPNWPEYELDNRYTMILSENPEVIKTSEDILREIWNDIL
ncbi:MAG: carboxylesterase family protein [Candidatus Lokiarchaeota archaeon]|nr:carboxylesterase family protein [Candidatus Lokiarchaeota archaeon]